jgi:hypothetical protein
MLRASLIVEGLFSDEQTSRSGSICSGLESFAPSLDLNPWKSMSLAMKLLARYARKISRRTCQ